VTCLEGRSEGWERYRGAAGSGGSKAFHRNHLIEYEGNNNNGELKRKEVEAVTGSHRIRKRSQRIGGLKKGGELK